MLTKEECVKALGNLHWYASYIANEFEQEELDADSRKLKQLINEHFDNPPLKFEELKEGMWVWDNKYKFYIKIRRVKGKGSFIGYYPNFAINPFTDEFYENPQGIFFFEENRYFRKKVEEPSNE